MSNRNTLIVPTRRLRKKTTLIAGPQKNQQIKQKTKKTSLAPVSVKKRMWKSHSGNKKATGKKPMVSITQKYLIMSKYEEALNRGDKHPIKAVEGMTGYFPGCVYESKWGHVYRSQRWDVFVHTAPQLCGKFKELPNALRRILKIKVMKHGQPGDLCDNTSYTTLPGPLTSAIETMLLARIDAGENISMMYVQNLLQMSVELWNQSVQHVKENLPEKCMEYLRNNDSLLSQLSPSEAESKVNSMLDAIQDRLKTVDVKQTAHAIKNLGCINVVF